MQLSEAGVEWGGWDLKKEGQKVQTFSYKINTKDVMYKMTIVNTAVGYVKIEFFFSL